MKREQKARVKEVRLLFKDPRKNHHHLNISFFKIIFKHLRFFHKTTRQSGSGGKNNKIRFNIGAARDARQSISGAAGTLRIAEVA